MLTGIGGQGIQLSAKTLAVAAVEDGLQSMLLGHYAGAMRGGQTDASVVVGDGPLRVLPILPATWSAIAMDPAYWGPTRERVRPGGVIVANSTLVHDLDRPDCRTFMVPASAMADEMGAPMSAGYILLGAYAAITGLVSIDALVAAMKQLVPPYRQQHVETNERALRAGGATGPALAAPAWTEVAEVGAN
jgi:2-oxoglutarate ferredoxin oxidoreductase subunit gamma